MGLNAGHHGVVFERVAVVGSGLLVDLAAPGPDPAAFDLHFGVGL